jgi:hypothetical protein
LQADVALETADDLFLYSPFACSFRHVVFGGQVPVHSDEGDGVNGFVELAVAAAGGLRIPIPQQ